MAPALKKPRIEGKSGKSKTKGELMQSLTSWQSWFFCLKKELVAACIALHCMRAKVLLKVLGILECNATWKHESFWCRLSWSKERTSSRNATTSSWTCAQAYRSWPRPQSRSVPFSSHYLALISLLHSKSLKVRTRLEKTYNRVWNVEQSISRLASLANGIEGMCKDLTKDCFIYNCNLHLRIEKIFAFFDTLVLTMKPVITGPQVKTHTTTFAFTLQPIMTGPQVETHHKIVLWIKTHLHLLSTPSAVAETSSTCWSEARLCHFS